MAVIMRIIDRNYYREGFFFFVFMNIAKIVFDLMHYQILLKHAMTQLVCTTVLVYSATRLKIVQFRFIPINFVNALGITINVFNRILYRIYAYSVRTVQISDFGFYRVTIAIVPDQSMKLCKSIRFGASTNRVRRNVDKRYVSEHVIVFYVQYIIRRLKMSRRI